MKTKEGHKNEQFTIDFGFHPCGIRFILNAYFPLAAARTHSQEINKHLPLVTSARISRRIPKKGLIARALIATKRVLIRILFSLQITEGHLAIR